MKKNKKPLQKYIIFKSKEQEEQLDSLNKPIKRNKN